MQPLDERATPPIPAVLGALIEPVYRGVVRARNRAFDRGARVTQLAVPVVSVGNLSVGGTGKTPMVMTIAQWLIEMGRRPVVAMRGYASGKGGASDEQMEYAQRFGASLRVVAQPDRLAGLRPLVEARAVDAVVLDDGFQHRFIARDLDIVLIDSTRSPLTDRCLPRGWLREPLESLSRATHIVLTRCNAVQPTVLDEIEATTLKFSGGAPVLRTAHRWGGLRAGDNVIEPGVLRGRRVCVACGIGNPRAFITQVREAGAVVEREIVRPDHHDWSAKDAAEILGPAGDDPSQGTWVVTTEKDWVKLRRVEGVNRATVVRPMVELTFISGEATLREALTGLFATEK